MAEFYENPLCLRYASDEMKRIFSPDKKFSTWRKLWLALAEGEKELGIDISNEQLDEMRAHLYDIDYDAVNAYEKITRHDVMAHLKAFCDLCPKARPIVHLGATSCYVGDNTDLILQKEALERIKTLLLFTMKAVAEFAGKYKALPTLSYTHFQAAQPTTVGKRATLWLQDLESDLHHVDFAIESLRLLGCRGTTGTGASFLELFNGDEEKVVELEKIIAKKVGFNDVYAVSGQTYPRKTDYFTLSALSGIAQSAQKFSGDIRLLSHLKEVGEPFESGQVGSSAMAYKQNPMRSERISSLSRFVIADCLNPAMTAGTQWLERTLDDSANRRISIPEAFLAIDGILTLYTNVISGLKVYPKVIEKHLAEELPFMATENILMYCVKKGGDRQTLHEEIRRLSVEAARRVKEEGANNDLLEKIASDSLFDVSKEEIENVIEESRFTGLAERQVDGYLKMVEEILKANESFLKKDESFEINV